MSSYTQATSADLVRMKMSDDLSEVLNIVQTLVERGEGLNDAAEILESKWAPGGVPMTRDVAKLICETNASSLYKKVGGPKGGYLELLIFYENRWPDQQIEDSLLNSLYGIAGDDANPFRRAIVEAIRKVGTVNCIPVLEAILYENSKSLDTKKAIATAVRAVGQEALNNLLTVLTADSATNFQELVAETIFDVRKRGLQPFSTDADSHQSNIKVVTNAHLELEKAKGSVNGDPISAVTCVRRGAEALGKHLYRHTGLEEERGQPAKDMMLGPLLKVINKSDAPKLFKSLMESLKFLGNFGAHDQDHEHDEFDVQTATAIIDLYEKALKIYENWINTSPK